jgi:hypothetical protein
MPNDVFVTPASRLVRTIREPSVLPILLLMTKGRTEGAAFVVVL